MSIAHPGPPRDGYFALVSYVPFPLGTFLDGLRRTLTHNDGARAHITVLPPRALRVPVEVASESALAVLDQFSIFEVELDGVARFSLTDILYLGLLDGDECVHALHSALNRGALSEAEQFEFLPHVTLGGPLPEPRLSAVEQDVRSTWERTHLSRRFELDEVVALWGSPGSENPILWSRLWTYSLRSRVLEHAAAGAG